MTVHYTSRNGGQLLGKKNEFHFFKRDRHRKGIGTLNKNTLPRQPQNTQKKRKAALYINLYGVGLEGKKGQRAAREYLGE